MTTDQRTHSSDSILNPDTRLCFNALARVAVPFMDGDRPFYSDLVLDAMSMVIWGEETIYVVVTATGTFKVNSIHSALELVGQTPAPRAILKCSFKGGAPQVAVEKVINSGGTDA